MLRRVGVWGAAATACFVVAVGIAELLLWATAQAESDWVRRAYLVREGYVSYRPNLKFSYTNERREEIPLEIDARGFRNPSDAFGKAQMLVLGDSFVAAVNTQQDRTIAGRLARAGYRVYNGGSDGSGTFHQLAILEDALKERAFDDIVVLFYTGNDFHDNLMTFDQVVGSVAQRWAKARIGASGAGNSIGDGTTRSRDGSDYGAIGARPGWRQAIMNVCDALRLCQQIYNNFWLGQVRGYARDPWSNRRFLHMQILTSAKASQIDKAMSHTRVALQAMKALAESKGSRLTIVAVPSRSEVMRSWYDMVSSSSIRREDLLDLLRHERADFDRPERMIRTLCSELGIKYHALHGDMRNAAMPSALFGVFDGHWFAEGQAAGFRSLDAYFKSAGIGVHKQVP